MALSTGSEVADAPATDRSPAAGDTVAWWRRFSLRWFTTFLVLVFPFATLFINRGDSFTLGLLVLIGVWAWIRTDARRWMNRDSAGLWIVCALFFAVALLSYVLGMQTDAGYRFLGRYLRFLLVVPVYLAFRRYPPTPKATFIGLAIGALLAGIIGGLHAFQADSVIRVEAATGLSIIFGDLATTMTLCVIAGFGLLAASRHKWSTFLLLVCLVGGVAAALLSGARGAWLPLFLLIPVFLIFARRLFRQRYVYVIALAIVVVFSSFYAVARTDTGSRIRDAFRSAQDYFIAGRTLEHEDTDAFGDPQCDDNRSFLIAWSRFYSFQSQVPASRMSVDVDPLLNQTLFCKGLYAVRLYNPNHVGFAGFGFPRMARTDGGPQSSSVLVRGVGFFGFDKAEQRTIHFNSSDYVKAALDATGWQGSEVRVYVAPRKSVWLVPMDGYYGEYSLTIANSSVGQRLEMWRAAWLLFLRHPLLGVGTGAYQMRTTSLINSGEVYPIVAQYDHPHSDYFNALASAGVFGVLVLLMLLVVPLVRFWGAIRIADTAMHAVGLAGMLTVIGFAIYALTDTVFLHSMMITWYVMYMALFYALLDVRAGGASQPESLKR